MGLNANNVPKGNGAERVVQPNIDPGSYPARVVSVIDLGVQPQRPWQGQVKPPAHMIRVTYELTDVFMVDKDGKEVEDKPRWLAEDFKLFNLSADLAVSTKRYNAIDPKGEAGGDWSKVLGNGVMLTVVNNPGKGANAGKIYDNIGGVSLMRQRDLDKLPELVNTPYFFDLTDPDPEVWKKIPQWLQEQIKGNIHYEGSALQDLVEGSGAPAKRDTSDNAGADAGKPADADPVADEPVGEDAPW